MVNVLYDKGGVLVCEKPRGVSAEHTDAYDGLPDLLAAQLGTPVFCVHRLDMPVGGVMLFAKNAKMAARLSAAMQTDEIEKTYYAVVAGKTEPQATLCDLLFHDRQKNRTYPVDRMRRGVKEATLTYRTLAYSPALDHSLVKIHLQTGRTHQIRAQFAARRHPLFGDGRYGSREKGELALWCGAMTVRAGVLTAQPLCVALPLPATVPWTLFEREKEEV